jgi:hypothetical protein
MCDYRDSPSPSDNIPDELNEYVAVVSKLKAA